VTAAKAPGVVLTSASAAQAAVSLVFFGLAAIGPELRIDYDMSLFALGAVLGAGVLGSGLALVGAGILVDRVGSRLAILAGTALGAVGLVIAAFAPTTSTLFAAIALSGVGSAVVPIAGAGALFAAYPPAGRGWALGVRQMSVPLGGTIAALAYPALHALGGSELTLLVSAAAVAVTGLGFALVVPGEPRASTERIARPFRAILTGLGMRRLLGVAACYVVVLSALLAYVVPSVRAAGHSELTASAAFFAVNVAAMVARIAWGKVADRHGGSRRVRTLVEVGVVALVGAVAFTLALHGPALLVIVAAFAFSSGALGWNALVYVSAGERVDSALAARSVAVAATVVFVLGGVVTPVLGALADVAGWDALWLTTAAIAGLGALLAAGLPASRVPRRIAASEG
jgi:MFS family permease